MFNLSNLQLLFVETSMDNSMIFLNFSIKEERFQIADIFLWETSWIEDITL
jgi:hypothetical protein